MPHLSPSEYGRLLEPLLERAGAYALSLLGRRGEAEDAVQQAALNGLQRLETYEPTRSFKSWWFAVLKNSCYDLLRERRTAQVESLDAFPSREGRAQAAGWEALEAALKRLSPEHQEVLRLKYFGAMKYHEIAQTLGIPEGTVMSRLHLARKALAATVNVEEL
jgi:RNA polymerase sigma factor (sigma-70 family)